MSETLNDYNYDVKMLMIMWGYDVSSRKPTCQTFFSKDLCNWKGHSSNSLGPLKFILGPSKPNIKYFAIW
jgi:hypothetical protein